MRRLRSTWYSIKIADATRNPYFNRKRYHLIDFKLYTTCSGFAQHRLYEFFIVQVFID